MFADELAKMEVKFKELLKINENTKLQVAAEEDHYKVGKGRRHLRVEFRLDGRSMASTEQGLLSPHPLPALFGCSVSGMEPLIPSLCCCDSVVYVLVRL